MQINLTDARTRREKGINFGVNIAKLAVAYQPPLLRYSVPAPRGQWVDRSIGRPDCKGTRNRLRAALNVAYKVWAKGLWPKDKPLPLSPKALKDDVPEIWRNFISKAPKTDPNGPHQIGNLVIADLKKWKQTWEALTRSAKIDAQNAALYSAELKGNAIPKNRIPALARSYNVEPENLTPEFLAAKSKHHLEKEEEFKGGAEIFADSENLTYGDLPKALDELQIPEGNIRDRVGLIPFGPWKPEWYTDASLNVGGPIRDN